MWQPVNAQTGQRLSAQTADWPILIHGATKSGASFFTVAMIADLIRHGQKVVFICARGEAVRSLQDELRLTKPESTFTEVSSQAATTLEDMQLVTLFKRKGTDLVTSLRALNDWSERVIVILNIEEVLTPQLWVIVQPHQRLILSGDFEKVPFEFDKKTFPLRILFSAAPGHWQIKRGILPSYIGDCYRGRQRFQTIVQEQRDSSNSRLDKRV